MKHLVSMRNLEKKNYAQEKRLNLAPRGILYNRSPCVFRSIRYSHNEPVQPRLELNAADLYIPRYGTC